ncbi:hypothetical protein B0H19DRAFT_1270238 [Mycena capillaripes]|nr:hypothetical protein B0H19DRAFT_1270238 [Mycena capillaripes]
MSVNFLRHRRRESNSIYVLRRDRKSTCPRKCQTLQAPTHPRSYLPPQLATSQAAITRGFVISIYKTFNFTGIKSWEEAPEFCAQFSSVAFDPVTFILATRSQILSGESPPSGIFDPASKRIKGIASCRKMPSIGHSSMVLLIFLASVVLLNVPCVASQVTPTFWNTTVAISRAERTRLAGAALDTAIDRVSADGLFDGEAFGVAGNLYSQMAQFDLDTNQTKYRNTLEQYLSIVQKARTNFSDLYSKFFDSSRWIIAQTNYGLSYGHAAARAYTAYKNPTFLQYAVQSWWYGRLRTISQSDLDAGKSAVKNFTLKQVCQDATMVGGTFWNNDPSEPSVSGVSTGSFLVLSALLAEITSDPLYLRAANESATFIHAHLYNLRNLVQNDISIDASEPCQVQSSTDPSSSGVMVEGLSILVSITNNGSTQKLLSDLIEAIIPDPTWHNANGIVTAQGIDGGLWLLRGLNAFYMRNSTNTALRRYVAHYMAVQFNAVTNLATANDTNIYGGSWTGPPNANFSGTNQTLALDVLINAIGLETFSPTSPSSSPSPTSSLRNPRPQKTAAILGGTLGALCILVLILMFLWWLRGHLSSSCQSSPTASVVPEPFLALYPARSHPREKRGGVRNPAPPSVPTVPANIKTAPDHESRRWEEGEAPPDYPAAW